MRLEALNQKTFEAGVAKMGMEQLVPKVDHLRPKADRPLREETPIPFMDGFSLHWDEFQRLDPDFLWDKFLRGLIEYQLLKIKALAEEEQTRVKFFRFNHPPTSHNVQSLVFDSDGVFAVLTVRHCVHQTHKDKGTEVAEFTFRVEIGKFDK